MKRRILLIEDDADFAEIVRDMLSNYKYEVRIVPDCAGAYDALTKEQFHLVLMDINLPDGTGFELCRELRLVSQVPVIFASARGAETTKSQGLTWAATTIWQNHIL